MIDADTTGLSPMVSGVPTPAAVVDPAGRFVVVNSLFATLLPHLRPDEGWVVGSPAGATEAVAGAQTELCKNCGRLAELELAVCSPPRGDAALLVTCGAGGDAAFELELRATLISAEESVLLVERGGRVRFASPSFESTTGRRAVDDDLVALFDPADHDVVVGVVEQSFAQPDRRVVARARLADRSGTARWVELTALTTGVGDEPALLVVGIRVTTGESTTPLGIVADADAPDAEDRTVAHRPTPAELADTFRSMSAAEQSEVIRALRS